MRKIVYAVYHDVNTEERSMELLRALLPIGEVHFVSYARPDGMPDLKCTLVDKRHPLALLKFISAAKRAIKRVRPDVVVLHDNDCSVLIPYVKRVLPSAKIVYDSSELYIDEGTDTKRVGKSDGMLIRIKRSLSSFRAKNEKRHLHSADLVFAANEERAEIMKEYFSLPELPSVFDNIHRIDTPYDRGACDEKLGYAFDDERFNVLFAGGIMEERDTFRYIEAFATLGDGYRLIIAGAASPVALDRYKKLLAELGIEQRVTYLGFITRAQLRYCMTRSQASVVIFDRNSYNTTYCASGKCYESLFEGVPILASENPPLYNLCREHGVGVSSDDYRGAVLRLKERYGWHLENVKKYIDGLDYGTRVERLTKEIERKIEEKC